MKNKKIFIIAVILVITAAALISVSTVLAYMFKRSELLDNQFVPANVQCAVTETFDGDTKTSVKAVNNGNIESYIRLRVVTYWQDSKGNTVAITAPEIKFGSEWKYNENSWLYDESEQTFYHKAPVAANGLTSELLKLDSVFSGIKLEIKTENYNGETYTYHPVVTFIAEAVQSVPAKAVSECWKVSIDSDGNIFSID